MFEALQNEKTRLDAAEDMRSLAGRIVDAPSEGTKADLWLQGDLAGIVTLATGKNTPGHPEDETVLLTMVAGAG
ncbi:MAG: hypothetical protein AAGF45_05430, partial [Pseudomonadota bacterium]